MSLDAVDAIRGEERMTVTVWFKPPLPPAALDPVLRLDEFDDEDGAKLAEAVLRGDTRIVSRTGPGAPSRKVVGSLSRDLETWRFVRAGRRAVDVATVADVAHAELYGWAMAFVRSRRDYASLDEKVEHRVALRELAHRLLLVRDKKLSVVVEDLARNADALESHRRSCFRCSPTRVCREFQRINREGSDAAADALSGKRVRP